jgi:hypothetical protein
MKNEVEEQIKLVAEARTTMNALRDYWLQASREALTEQCQCTWTPKQARAWFALGSACKRYHAAERRLDRLTSRKVA